MEKIRKKLRKDQEGTTMVSVMVAFVILLIALSMLGTAMTAANNMIARARIADQNISAVMEAFYGQYSSTESGTSTGLLVMSGSKGSFTLNGSLKEYAPSDPQLSNAIGTIYYYSLSQN